MTTTPTDTPRLAGEKPAKHRCAKCGESDPKEFRKNARMRSGLSSYCKECHRQLVRDWRARNPDYLRAYNEKRRVLGPDGYHLNVCAVCGVEFKTRRKHTRLCGEGKCREVGLGGIELYRARLRERNHARRKHYVAPPDALRLRPAEVRDLLSAAVACPLCGVEFSDTPHDPAQRNLDHIIPLAAGGAHVRENVRVICRKCNLARPHDGSDVEGQVALWAVAV